MKRNGFFDRDAATLTVMVQADNPDRVAELMAKAVPQGAEAFGMQFERMKACYRNRATYERLFALAGDKPVYVTNYRVAENEGKRDEVLAEELLELAACGADLCDMMGDYYDPQAGEMTYDAAAVEKQKNLIAALHEKGAKVLMSSHIFRFTPAEEVLKIALSHQSRGADISKIVVGADNMEQQLENMRILHLLREKLDIPFLMLSVGECKLLRRVGGELGNCMYLCVVEYDALATPVQPLLTPMKAIRDAMQM